MKFLQLDDFDISIRKEFLQGLSGNNLAILDKIEMIAIKEASSYLRPTFDASTIFSKNGNERDEFLVKLLVDISLYHLSSQKNTQMIPQMRIDNYDYAITYFKDLRDGIIDAELPRKKDEDGENERTFYFGSQSKRDNFY